MEGINEFCEADEWEKGMKKVIDQNDEKHDLEKICGWISELVKDTGGSQTEHQ